MSHQLIEDNGLGQLELWFSIDDDEKIGTFQLLNCEEHGDTIHFTDMSGADNCVTCIEDKIQASLPPKYKLPNYEEVMGGLNRLTIGASTKGGEK